MGILNKIVQTYKDKGLNYIIKALDIKIGIGRIEYLLYIHWINPFATIWLNFRQFPIYQALRFPVFVYGRPSFICLSGKMIIKGPISSGMVKFNQSRPGSPSFMGLQSELFNTGFIIFKGKGTIGTGNKIRVAQQGVLEIDNNFIIADMCNIACYSQIKIGTQTRIAHRCQILDSNYHFVANFAKRTIPYHTHPIIIGRNCWICNTSTVSGGSILPNFTIVASNSLVNRDYSSVSEYSLIGGVPAKLLTSGVERVYNKQKEKEIYRYLHKHPNSLSYIIPEGDSYEDYI